MTCACCGPSSRRLDRRSLLGALSAGVLLVGCSENPQTGRKQFAVVSDEQLVGMADQAWADLAAQTPRSDDAALQARLAGVGRKIAATSGRNDLDWDFTVFDRPEVNAFVLPNGKVGAFRGLMELAKDNHELAAVLGHEVGHILARHPAERVSQELAVKLGVAAVQMVMAQGDYADYADEVAGALGMGAMYGVILPYSRDHELEADRVGVGLAAKAGYQPAGAVRFFERMAQVAEGQPKPPEVLSTHPADETRLTALRQVVAEMGRA